MDTTTKTAGTPPPTGKGPRMSRTTRIEFDSPINEEGSWGGRLVAEKAHSTMEFVDNGDGTGNIEWVVKYADGGEDVEQVGIWYKSRTLVDYDDVMSFSEQMAQVLQKAGISVPVEFHDWKF
jgi:hypothetical protein